MILFKKKNKMSFNNDLFIRRHPEPVRDSEEIKYYVNLADELYALWERSGYMKNVPDTLRQEAVIAVTGYFEDIASDLGLWRSFIRLNRKFYGNTLPFYHTPEDYIDFELNPIDVRFLLWYVLSIFPGGNMKRPDPMDSDLARLSDDIAFILDECYEEAPPLDELFSTRDLDFHAEEDADRIMTLGSWLYWKSYLLYPALEANLPYILQDVDTTDNGEVTRRLSQAQMDYPTGPLALYLREWMYMIINHRLPAEKKIPNQPDHPYFTRFSEATGNQRVKFFSNYADLNRFFIESMGWERGTEHLANLKNHQNFTLFVSRDKGMLVARDVAACINAPGNSLFDKKYARANSYALLTEKGRCPADLLRYCISMGWLTEAVYPDHPDIHVNDKDADFLARCFLQLYYRD